MGVVYRPAPGCSFRPTGRKTFFARHLQTKSWCPCKQANWTIEDAFEGCDGRKQQACRHARDSSVQVFGNNNTVDNSTNVVINLISPCPILASGSDEERAYLLQHAAGILHTITAGTEEPDAEIISRFVRETWCSAKHEALNNVLALKSNNLEFIRLCEVGGERRIETLAGKEALPKLVTLATNNMTQMAKDSCGGHNPATYTPPIFDVKHDTREEAEKERSKHGAGQVVPFKIFGKPTDKWINDRSTNAPPSQEPPVFKQAAQVAWVPDTLKRKRKEKQHVEKVVSAQLRNMENKRDRKRKLQVSSALR